MAKKKAVPQEPILGLIGRIVSLMRKELNRRLDGVGTDLTGEQGVLLKMLTCSGVLNQQELAERLFKDKAGVSRLLAAMETKGLIARTSTIEDRRNNYVELSAAGRDALVHVEKQIDHVRSQAVSGIPTEDLDVCRRVLEQIRENLSSR